MKISVEESNVIRFLKTTMLLLIVFGHMNPETVSVNESSFKVLSISGLSNLIYIGISYILCHFSVVTYFLLSGFLFGIGFEKWDWSLYKRKINSRYKTLLIPYISWNLIPMLSFIIYYFFIDLRDGLPFENIYEFVKNNIISGFWNSHIWGLSKTNWLGYPTPNSGPFSIALWFIRDLMVVSLLSPVIFWILKKTKGRILVLLFICYWSKIWPQIQGFSIDATFFFSIGLYLSINKKNLVASAKQMPLWVFAISVISFCFCVYNNGIKSDWGRFFFPIFTTTGVWGLIIIASVIVRKITPLPKVFVQGSFFVYLLHACPFARIGSLLRIVDEWTSPLKNFVWAGDLLKYLISPFLICTLSLLIFVFIKVISPKMCNILVGLRSDS